MQIVQATFGVFHQFELAHEMRRRGHLCRIYSTWPWARVKREGVPRALVRTFPALAMAELALARMSWYAQSALSPRMKRLIAESFDSYTRRTLPACDALVALSGAGLRTGAMLQARGGIFVCDSGSSHRRFQDDLLKEEHARWGVPFRAEDEDVIAHDERIYAQADAIVIASAFAARSFAQMGVPAEKVHRIPYGVRLDHFRRTVAPPPIGERFEVLFAGQVSLRKGIPYLLQAFAKVRHRNKRLRILGSVVPGFESTLARLPQGSVEFLGSRPQGELARAMGESHVLVLPSIEDGFGLVMGQAMSCGCPVIASSNTGGEDLFSDGLEGFTVPIRDAEALTERMERLIDEPGLQARMAALAVERVAALGGWDAYGRQWDELLHRLTGIPRDADEAA